MTAASSRPRDVLFAGVLTIIGAVLALTGIFGAQGQLRSSSVRRQIESLLADEQLAAVDLSVDTVLTLVETGLMVASAASVAAIVLAVFVMRGHNPSRIALSVLGAVGALLALVSGLAGVAIAVFLGYTVSLLWRGPVRSWFAAVSAGEAAAGGGGDAHVDCDPWTRRDHQEPPNHQGREGHQGHPGSQGRDPQAEPPRQAAGPWSASGGAGEAPEPRWRERPVEPAHGAGGAAAGGPVQGSPEPGAAPTQPAPYPHAWPPEPGSRPAAATGHAGATAQADAGGPSDRPHPYGPPPQPYGSPTGQQPPGPNQPGPNQPGPTQPGPNQPGQPPMGQPPSGGQPPAPGHPGAYGPAAGYGYPPGPYGYPSSAPDPSRRPGQVVAAHVLTWVGAAFGLVTGLFFLLAASSQDLVDLVTEQLGEGQIDRTQFVAALRVAGVVTALWSLAVATVSVFSWRRANWAAIVLTVMGGGYVLVQLVTLLTGQLAVLFTIVWVAVVIVLLWWPASRHWYTAPRTPRAPRPPYGGGAPPAQPPTRNRPW